MLARCEDWLRGALLESYLVEIVAHEEMLLNQIETYASSRQMGYRIVWDDARLVYEWVVTSGPSSEFSSKAHSVQSHEPPKADAGVASRNDEDDAEDMDISEDEAQKPISRPIKNDTNNPPQRLRKAGTPRRVVRVGNLGIHRVACKFNLANTIDRTD